MYNYIPEQVKILQITNLTTDVKLFRLDLPDYNFMPGQFVMAGLLGIGEAPISIASGPQKNGYIELAIKKVGKLTEKLFELKKNDYISIRGPYGNGFNIKKFKNKKLVIISAGLGLVPMRSIIEFASQNKNYFKNLQILYGARDFKNILFNNEIKSWKKFAEIIVTLDQANNSWAGNVGRITNIINNKIVHVINSVILVCGPPIIYKPIGDKLIKMGVSENDIYFSLERNMQCGLGLCQHCTCGEKYVCKDGPVFSLSELKKMEYKKD
jgi:NAD(P)H-flavin reductase